jgi:16S rRNA processing protein RimM
MGHVSGPFGVRGWVKIHVYTEAIDSLFDYPVWWLGREGSWKEYRRLDGEVHSKGPVALLEGVADRDATLALKGLQVAVPRSEMPEAEADSYYWNDLIGLKVVNLQGETLGTVDSLFETGANDVLRVLDGEVERLIPFVGHYVQDVDLKAGVVKVDWGVDY